MALGIIKTVVCERGYGFIRPKGTTDRYDDVFFHAHGLDGLEFGEHLREMEVEYRIEQRGDKFRAVDVKAAE